MLTLPDTPFPILQITRSSSSPQEQFLQEILIKRLSINTTNSNTALLISNLEEYLNLIYSTVVRSQKVEYTDVLDFCDEVVLNETCIPWTLPITKKKNSNIEWRLSNEIIIVLINLIFSYNQRSNEIISKVLRDQDSKGLSEKEIQQLWINSFKLYKKSMIYLNFLKLNKFIPRTDIYETSLNFVDFMDHLISCSIQLTFLSKSIWTLKQSEYNITIKTNNLNYSTLSRISIFVRDQLKLMINGLKSVKIDNNWIGFLENLSSLNNAYIGTLLSIENYKLDHIGKSIGFLNIAIENISKKSNNEEALKDEFENDSKLKKKLLTFKKKLNTNDDKKAIKMKNLKLNKKIFESLSNSLNSSINNLFQLIEILNLKYHLENNNLKFDQIMNSTELYQNHLPTGRSVPVSDENVSWIPDISKRSTTTENNQTPYY